MKRFLLFLTAGCLLYPIINYGSETAHARLYCASLQFQEARANDSYGFQMKVDLTTLSSGINGELAPFFLAGTYTNYTHSAYVKVYSEAYGTTDTGGIGLDVPSSGDANGDGYPDFFEVSQPVNNLTSSGLIYTPNLYYSGYSFTATWNRAAGSSTGTCSYQLYDPSNPYFLITFTHTFTLIEYTGPLTYTPGSNTVSAAVNLVQTGNSANTLQGPIVFVKSSTDPFNTLTNQSGVWTNAASQTLSFDSEIYTRYIPNWPTNYAGYVFFTDGDPSTASADYQLWVLSIDDTNDADANGIPDFSDNPAVVAPPRTPQLTLTLGSTNLLLTISGDVGHTNQIQEIGSLGSTNWLPTLTFKLASDPQVVSLPLPASAPKFWRVIAW